MNSNYFTLKCLSRTKCATLYSNKGQQVSVTTFNVNKAVSPHLNVTREVTPVNHSLWTIWIITDLKVQSEQLKCSVAALV